MLWAGTHTHTHTSAVACDLDCSPPHSLPPPTHPHTAQEKNPHGVSLFEAEQRELLQSLYDIPQRSCDRKINEFVKRVRALKIHLLLVRQR